MSAQDVVWRQGFFPFDLGNYHMGPSRDGVKERQCGEPRERPAPAGAPYAGAVFSSLTSWGSRYYGAARARGVAVIAFIRAVCLEACFPGADNVPAQAECGRWYQALDYTCNRDFFRGWGERAEESGGGSAPLARGAGPGQPAGSSTQPHAGFTLPPCTVCGGASSRRAEGARPAPAAVRRGWGGREGRRRAAGRAARARSWAAEGEPAAPAAAHCLQTGPRLGPQEHPTTGAAPSRGRQRGTGILSCRPGGLGGGRSSQVKLLLSPCGALSSWKPPRGDGRSRRRRRRRAPALSLSLGETNPLSGSQLSNLPIMILA